MRQLRGRISHDGLWLYRTASQRGDPRRYLRRRGKRYNRRGARHHGSLLIHVERKRMFTAISTLSYSIAPAAHRLKPLRVHVRTIHIDQWIALAGHRARFPKLSHALCLELPLPHALERTVDCYLPMMAGSCVAYTREIAKLAGDIATVRPTIPVSVPRIYERMYSSSGERF